MADPFVATAIYAHTKGLLDFTGYAPTRHWRAKASVALAAARRELNLETLKLEAKRLFAEALLPGAGNVSDLIAAARNTSRKAMAELKPWWRNAIGSRRGTDPLDLAAQWYIMAVPEKLAEWGIDLGALEPTSRSRRGRPG